MKNFLKAVLFVVVAILAINISGCATGSNTYTGVRQVDAFSGNDAKYQEWENLIKHGQDIGVDFTDPIFSTLDDPAHVHRFCYSDIYNNLKNGAYGSKTIEFCVITENYSSIIYTLTDKKNTPLDYMKDNLAGLVEILPDFGITGKGSIDKVSEKDGISYYLLKVGDKYFTYRGVVFFETEKMKRLGVKLAIVVGDKSTRNATKSLNIITKKAELLRSKMKEIE